MFIGWPPCLLQDAKPTAGRCSAPHADYRFYTQDDLATLERICFFREAGLSLSEIAHLLKKTNCNSSILERRLRRISQKIATLKSQQRLITSMLKMAAMGLDASGLDMELWLSLQQASGLDVAAAKRWHTEFERRAPRAHNEFLLSLGLTEKEATQVRLLTKSVKDNKMTMKYFFELFEDLPRQGPGCREATLKAIGLLKHLPVQPSVLDIGCGSGMQTQILAQELETKILAIDNHRSLLDQLDRSSAEKGLGIETRELSMIDMPFADESFDLLWAEGSIFIIGLEQGLKDFRVYLKPGGYLAFTEMCWFVSHPPTEVRTYLDKVYPDIRSPDQVGRAAAASGYRVIEHFNLPESAWWDDYYTPMLEHLQTLKLKNAGVTEAEEVYAACEEEIEMFRRHSKSYGYTFFVLQKT